MAREIAAQNPSSRGKLTLYLGLGAGLLAAVLVAVVLSGSGGDSPSKTNVVPATRVAVIAARDIPARTRITPDMLRVQPFKLEDVSPDAFTSVGQLTDRVTSADIKSGQEIIPALVSTTRGEGLNFAVQPGMRAVSIDVKEVVTVGGNVVPGNYVDILGIFGIDAGTDIDSLVAGLLGAAPTAAPRIAGGKSQLTITLLQNVKVLAVAQNIQNVQQNAEAPGAPAAKGSPNPRATTVTLEVNPRQAQVLALADQRATLRLSLRPFGEDTNVPVAPFITRID